MRQPHPSRHKHCRAGERGVPPHPSPRWPRSRRRRGCWCPGCAGRPGRTASTRAASRSPCARACINHSPCARARINTFTLFARACTNHSPCAHVCIQYHMSRMKHAAHVRAVQSYSQAFCMLISALRRWRTGATSSNISDRHPQSYMRLPTILALSTRRSVVSSKHWP